MNTSASIAASSPAGRLEKTHLRLGFVALSDAAPLVAAKLLEFGHAHGLTLELQRQPSWAAVRDKLLSGDLDAAHALYGLVYGVQLGLGGPRTDMAVLMVLNRNGQAVTLSNRLADALAQHGSLPKALATLGRKPVFAQTFPTGTHAMWLYYWLASQGVHPLRDIESVAIPPPQMVAALAEEIFEPRGLFGGVSHPRPLYVWPPGRSPRGLPLAVNVIRPGVLNRQFVTHLGGALRPGRRCSSSQ